MAGALVRGFWRRLPVGFRRALAHGTLSMLAPRLLPAPPPADDAPRIVVGFLTSASGLGQSARLAMAAFEARGHKVYGVDLSRFFFETASCVRFDFRDGRRKIGPAHVLININAPYLSYVFHLLGRKFLREKYVTAYWAWELPRAPPSWREGLSRAHRIAAPSTFVADAIRGLGEGRPIMVAPHPVALERLPDIAARTAPVSAAAPFTVVSSFNAASGFERKNPLALIAAFRQAFAGRGDTRLRLLASNIEHYAPGEKLLREAAGEDARIELTFGVFDREQYWRWYGAPDLYASLHRAEGFGLPLAEAMCMGVPVLATAWSANVEYMDESSALMVRARLAPIADPQQKYAAGEWAEPDVAHAAELLRRALAEPGWLAERARTGQTGARARFSRFAL